MPKASWPWVKEAKASPELLGFLALPPKSWDTGVSCLSHLAPTQTLLPPLALPTHQHSLNTSIAMPWRWTNIIPMELVYFYCIWVCVCQQAHPRGVQMPTSALLSTLFFYLSFAYECPAWHTWGGHRTACRSWFSPFSLWVPRVTLGSSGLGASTFACWVISLISPPYFLRQGFSVNLQLGIMSSLAAQCS